MVHKDLNFLRGIGKEAPIVKALIKEARKAGWTVTITRANHIKMVSPEGKMVVASMTARSGRSVKHLRAELRKAGLNV